MPSMASNTIYGIITNAMQDAGYLQQGEVPNSQNLADFSQTLCDIINLWQTQGLKLFLNQVITFPMVANQSVYSFGPGGTNVMQMPKRVIQANVITPSGVRRPLVALSWNEWMRLSQVIGNASTVSSYFVDKQPTLLKVHLWNAPNATDAMNSCEFLMQVGAPMPINLEEDMQFPDEWRIALRWALADEICTGQPQAIMDRCATRANAYRQVLEDWDVEDADTSFAPDMRRGYGQRRIR